MLPESLLHVGFYNGHVSPRFLRSRDEPWVRALIQEVDAFVGCPAQELDEELQRKIVPQLIEQGGSRIATRGVAELLRRWWLRKVVSPARPAEIRRALFECAATGCSRSVAIEEAARGLGITPNDVLTGLFADRPGARKIVAPEHPPDPGCVVEQYNLALVQTLLFRAERVTVWIQSHVRSVVRFAKLKGLLCTYRTQEKGTLIELSGPLSLFRHTTRYGRALTQFFPCVVSTPGWSLGASCWLRPPPWEQQGEEGERQQVELTLDASAPLRATHTLPSDADSAVERTLMRQVRRLRRGWSIERETKALRTGSSVFFPDFTLRRGNEEILVEVVGYYTSAYLEAKLDKLRKVRAQPFIVCVDRNLACADDDINAECVLRYHRKVDAAALLDAADRLVDGG